MIVINNLVFGTGVPSSLNAFSVLMSASITPSSTITSSSTSNFHPFDPHVKRKSRSVPAVIREKSGGFSGDYVVIYIL